MKAWKMSHCLYWGKTSILTFQNLDSEKEKELERQARIEASLREREREVQKARSEQTKEIDREREQHKREEAIQNFKALLSDMVRHQHVLSDSLQEIGSAFFSSHAVYEKHFGLYRSRIVFTFFTRAYSSRTVISPPAFELMHSASPSCCLVSV